MHKEWGWLVPYRYTCRYSESAMIDGSDKDLFFRKTLLYEGAIAAGAYIRENPMVFPVNKPYIKDKLWLGMKNSLGAATAITVVINFHYAYVSDAILARIIARKI